MPADASPGDSAVPRSARLVLAAGIVAGLGNMVAIALLTPDQVMLASDVYRTAAEALLAGDNIYEVAPPGLPGYHFLYPPIVVLLFLPHAIVGSSIGAFAIQAALHTACGVGLGLVVERALRRRGVPVTPLDRGLFIAFTVTSAHSAIVLLNGQVTLWLGLAVALAFDALERGRESRAGAALAAAALVKVFPAAIGVWFLRHRNWRAIAVAVATGVGGLVAGALLLGPDLTVTYLQDVLLARYSDETFHGRPAPDQTVGGIQRHLAAVFGLSSPLLSIVAVGVMAPLVGILYRNHETDVDALTAMLGTILAILLLFPLQRLYMPLFAFPLVVLLYVLPAGRPRTLLVAGTLVTFLRPGYGLVVDIVHALPLPGDTAAIVLVLVESVFTVTLVPTIGLWVLLAACLLQHVDVHHVTQYHGFVASVSSRFR